MLSDDEKQKVLSLINEIEQSILTGDGVTIRALCEDKSKESGELRNSSDSLTPILRTALVINWKESAMKSRYDRFRHCFPEIATLADLKRVMERTAPFEFCRQYLNINANRSAADKNPKYCLLKTLTNGFLEYQKFHNIPSEIEAIRHWSANVKPNDLKHDFIAKMHGVGPGVVGNIKLNLGERVIKPDRHVIGVMKEFLEVDIPFHRYNEFATFIGLDDPRYLDCILFEYGKLKKHICPSVC